MGLNNEIFRVRIAVASASVDAGQYLGLSNSGLCRDQ